jgi:hypothetical protein
MVAKDESFKTWTPDAVVMRTMTARITAVSMT